MQRKLEDLQAIAGRHSIAIATYSPGDGATRYHFVALDLMKGPARVDYFAITGAASLGTAVGLKAAEARLWAIIDGLNLAHTRAERATA